MTTPAFHSARDLFVAARALPKQDRHAFLQDQCGANEAMRRDVETLLMHDSTGGGPSDVSGSRTNPLDAPAFGGAAAILAALGGLRSVPDIVGQYRVIGLIAEGGMGCVYEARQLQPDRRVALKMLRPGSLSPAAIARFEQESRILARLQHPGIAQIFESGAISNGESAGPIVPFFAMEFIQGPNLAQHVASRSLGPAAIVELVAGVCDAVDHAHRRGVVHRDLKPANILVVEGAPAAEGGGGGAPQVKVLDFGVARAVQDGDLGTLLRTLPGQMVGTPAYMSPEQIDGSPDAVESASDVYSIGVILYELLTGRLPHEVRSSQFASAARSIRDQDPRRMSRIRRELRGDLETIVLKAMEKHPSRRYDSAGALGADLRRYLGDKPIAARPPTILYRARKFAARNRGLVAGLAATLVVLIAGTVLSTRFAIQEAGLRLAALDQAEKATRASYRMALAAGQAHSDDSPNEAFLLLEGAPYEMRNWEWHHLRRRLECQLRSEASDAAEGAAVAVDPAGVPVAAVVRQGRLEIVNLDDGRTRQVLGSRGSLGRPQVSASGERLAAIEVGAFPAPCLAVFEFVAGAFQRTLTIEECDHFRLAQDAPVVAVSAPASDLRVLSTDDGRLLGHIEAPSGFDVIRIGFDTSARRVAALFMKRIGHWTARGIELPRGATFFQGPEAERLSHALDHRAGRSVTWFQRELVVSHPDGVGEPMTLRGHLKNLTAAAISPDGTRLASASEDNTLRVWHLGAGTCTRVLRITSPVTSIRWSSREDQLLVSDLRGRAIVLAMSPLGVQTLQGHSTYVYHAAFSPDGTMVVSGGWNDELLAWDVPTGRLLGTLLRDADASISYIKYFGFSRDGSELYVKRLNGERLRWRLADIREGSLSPTSSESPSDFAPTELLGLDRTARASRNSGGQYVAVSDDGALVADVQMDDRVAIFGADPRDARVIGPFSFGPKCVAFSPDGMTLAIGGEAGTIVLYALRTGTESQRLGAPGDTIYSLAYSPDGLRLASGGNDNLVRLFDAETLEHLITLPGHRSYVHSVSFSPDGRQLVSASGDGTVRIWDAPGTFTDDPR